MGRNKSKYYKRTLHQQAYDKLQSMIAFGESKANAKKNGATGNKIYSKSTYQTYKKHINYFVKYIMKTHPEVKSMKKAKKYVAEWLELRVAEGCSAWTINLEAAALNKFYEIAPDDPNSPVRIPAITTHEMWEGDNGLYNTFHRFLSDFIQEQCNLDRTRHLE